MAFGRKAKDTVSTTGEYLRATNEVSRPMAAVMVLFMVLAIAAIGFTLFAVGKWAYDSFIQDEPATVEQAPADQAPQGTEQPAADQPSQTPTTDQQNNAATGGGTNTPGGTAAPSANTQPGSSAPATNGTTAPTSNAPASTTNTGPQAESIPSTGPEQVIALFIGSTIFGALGYRAYALQRVKR